jgi:hypothetical protein
VALRVFQIAQAVVKKTSKAGEGKSSTTPHTKSKKVIPSLNLARPEKGAAIHTF